MWLIYFKDTGDPAGNYQREKKRKQIAFEVTQNQWVSSQASVCMCCWVVESILFSSIPIHSRSYGK